MMESFGIAAKPFNCWIAQEPIDERSRAHRKSRMSGRTHQRARRLGQRRLVRLRGDNGRDAVGHQARHASELVIHGQKARHLFASRAERGLIGSSKSSLRGSWFQRSRRMKGYNFRQRGAVLHSERTLDRRSRLRAYHSDDRSDRRAAEHVQPGLAARLRSAGAARNHPARRCTRKSLRCPADRLVKRGMTVRLGILKGMAHAIHGPDTLRRLGSLARNCPSSRSRR